MMEAPAQREDDSPAAASPATPASDAAAPPASDPSQRLRRRGTLIVALIVAVAVLLDLSADGRSTASLRQELPAPSIIVGAGGSGGAAHVAVAAAASPGLGAPPPGTQHAPAAVAASPAPTPAPSPPPPFDVLVMNLDDKPEFWHNASRRWTPLLPHVRRLPASHLERRTGRQSLCHTIMRALETLRAEPSHPWVVVLEDDALPTPAFARLWPAMVAELSARLGDWDIVQTGALFEYKLARNPVIAPVRCSRVFMSVPASTAGQMIIYNRSVLRLARKWLASVRAGKDVVYNDLFFTINGPGTAKLKKAESAEFRVWHPRESISTQSVHVSETTPGKVSNFVWAFSSASKRIAEAAEATLPPLNATSDDPRLLGCEVGGGGDVG